MTEGVKRYSEWARRATIYIFAGALYSCLFASQPSWAWLAPDVVVIAACAWCGRREPHLLDAFVALAVVMFVFAVIPDRNIISLDETEYLRTMHRGFIVRDGIIPFNVRWLGPVIAGPLDLFPARDLDGLKAVNFAALVLAAAELTRFIRIVGAAPRLARFTPIFLVGSYLGIYAATNRLVLDPINYAMFTLIACQLYQRKHVAALLVIAAFNSEKTVYWFPIVIFLELVESRRLLPALKRCAPAVIYLVLVFAYVHGASTQATESFFEQLDRMGFTWLTPQITDPVVAITQPQMLWFPFGAMTIYALFGLRVADRRMQLVSLMLIPVMLQVLIAHDAERMVAYSFIVYLPLAFLYLTKVVEKRPRWVETAIVVALVLIAMMQHFLLPACKLAAPHFALARVVMRGRYSFVLALEALELLVVTAIVWADSFFARD